MKMSMKSLAVVVALAAANLANAQTYTIIGGWDREIPPNFVKGDWIALNQDFTHSCAGSFWGVELYVSSFTWAGDTFTHPVWSTGTIADCTQPMDDLFLIYLAGGTGGPSGLDGRYRAICNLNGYPNCSGAALTLTSGSSTASPANWSCAQVVVTMDVVLVSPRWTLV